MPTVPKSPGQPWPRAARGLIIQLLPGVHQAVQLDGVPDLTILGGDGVVIAGDIRPSGGEDPCTIRVMDGCDRLLIQGPLEVRGSQGRGVRITGGRDIALANIESHDHGIESIILGNCPGATLSDLFCHTSRSTGATSADRRHGLYVSGDASRTTITDLTVEDVTGSGLQVNGASLGFVIGQLAASALHFTRCGSGGTPPISLMAVQGATFENFCVDDTPSDRWAVLFADGQGQQFACTGNTFRTYTVPRGTHAAEEEGSRGNTYAPGAGWSPDQPPEPTPPEPTPPDVQADLDAIDQALSAIVAEVNTAQAALARVESALSGGGT